MIERFWKRRVYNVAGFLDMMAAWREMQVAYGIDKVVLEGSPMIAAGTDDPAILGNGSVVMVTTVHDAVRTSMCSTSRRGRRVCTSATVCSPRRSPCRDH